MLKWLLQIFQNWILVRSFVSREIKGRYAGTVGGLAWTMAGPLAIMAIYMVIFSQVFRVQVTAHETGTDSFIVYFLTGFFPWIVFSEGVTRSATSLLDNAILIAKAVFPPQVLPFSSIIGSWIVPGLGLVCMLVFVA